MTKFTAFIILIALRIAYHPLPVPSAIAPFASPTPYSSSTLPPSPAKIINVEGNIRKHKVILNWVVSENETARQFEVEKSTDGKNFFLTALVFGTDQPATGNYQYFEKAGIQKTIYRIKLINKNQQTEYSSLVIIHPDV